MFVSREAIMATAEKRSQSQTNALPAAPDVGALVTRLEARALHFWFTLAYRDRPDDPWHLVKIAELSDEMVAHATIGEFAVNPTGCQPVCSGQARVEWHPTTDSELRMFIAFWRDGVNGFRRWFIRLMQEHPRLREEDRVRITDALAAMLRTRRVGHDSN
ncbi:hypothetical protein C4552_00260 [Candidatus Parcubacteria bacterium]|nr:MAG: hypothetical protein C4552_00260 [Candidatus Parcubacteria bacterium]